VSRDFVLGTRVTELHLNRGGRLHGTAELHSRGRLIAQASGVFLSAPGHGD
jgi:hypothetical protein